MQISNVLIIILAVVAIAVFFGIILLKIKNKEIEFQKYRFTTELVDQQFIDETQRMLDEFIKSCMTDLFIANPNIIRANDYITEDAEIKLRNNVSSMVCSRLSNAMTARLALVYSDQSIASIIGERIYFAVTQYVINNNSAINGD